MEFQVLSFPTSHVEDSSIPLAKYVHHLLNFVGKIFTILVSDTTSWCFPDTRLFCSPVQGYIRQDKSIKIPTLHASDDSSNANERRVPDDPPEQRVFLSCAGHFDESHEVIEISRVNVSI